MRHMQEAVLDLTRRYSAAGYFPSASLCVFDRNETLCRVHVGDAGNQSLFDAASLTKLATATQILFLIDEGALSLDTPIAACLDEIERDAYLRARFEGVTVRRLLTHTSSLAAWYPFYEKAGEPFFDVLRHALQNTQPTQGVVYSDLNFMLLGRVLERKSSLALADCLQQKLVKPLSLGAMLYRPSHDMDVIPSGYGNAIEEGMCARIGVSFTGFRARHEAVHFGVQDGNAHYYFDDAAGHAGIFADAEAYARLCRFYMNADNPLFVQAQREQPGAPGRGLGFQLGAMYPHGCGHTGFTGTSVYFSREQNIGAVALTNRLYDQGIENEHSTNDFRRALHETVLAVARAVREG